MAEFGSECELGIFPILVEVCPRRGGNVVPEIKDGRTDGRMMAGLSSMTSILIVGFFFLAGQSDVLVIDGSGTLDRGRYHRCGTRRFDAEDRDPSRGRDVDLER